ncbi:MAG: MBL fold metallo-hydrolase [Chloroflexi bacterium]|nr:MBL fold metallo-hydrolase [Chloroflexota bacterium]
MRIHTLGQVRIVQLHDGYGSIDGNRVFYPAKRADWAEGLCPDPRGYMLNAYQPLLITENGQHTLVDTGFGENNPARKGDLQADLEELGVARADITRVVITHAHGDHVGGNTLLRDEQRVQAYPRAEYLVQESEIAGIRARNTALWRESFAPLQKEGQLRPVAGRISLSQAIELWPLAGHTEGHQGVHISSGDQDVLFVGDLGLSIKNFHRPEWGSSWAWSLEEDEANRRRVCEWASAHGSIVILYHDPRTPWFRITATGESYETEPA